MKLLRILLILCMLLAAWPAAAQHSSLVIRTSTLYDGQGEVMHDASIVVTDGTITMVDKINAPVDYDLRGLTVLPGWIDTHVHIGWHFGPNGRLEDSSETPRHAALATEANAWATLMAGFTTVQSLGAPDDKDVRDMIAQGVIPGPSILTSLEPLTDPKLTPDQIRAFVQRAKQNGADVIKIFASKSIREGGGQTLSDEQLQAACREAKRVGLRAVVHAYKSAVGAASRAGCMAVEHGTLASDDDLRTMAANGTFFDPQVGLVIQNYLDNKQRFLGIGNYTEEGFEQMKKALPLNAELMKRALATKGLKIVFGTDAVAGAHGHNAEEFIYRVRDGGQDPMAALVSANGLAAQSLGRRDIGIIATGAQADIIALEGDPLTDITAVRRVVFVMKGGKVYKFGPRGK